MSFKKTETVLAWPGLLTMMYILERGIETYLMRHHAVASTQACDDCHVKKFGSVKIV